MGGKILKNLNVYFDYGGQIQKRNVNKLLISVKDFTFFLVPVLVQLCCRQFFDQN